MAEAKPKKTDSEETVSVAVKKTAKAAPKKVPAKKVTTAKKPAPKAAKPPADDEAEIITVNVKKSAPIEEAPEPATDEALNLKTDAPLDKMNSEDLDAWFSDLDKLEAPADKPKNSDSAEAHDDKIDLHTPIENLLGRSEKEATPEPTEPKAADEGTLRGFIQNKPLRKKATSVHPAGEAAREQLMSPKVFDTAIIHKAIDRKNMPTQTRQTAKRGSGWFMVIVVLIIAAGVYAAIDLGLLGTGIKVPWHIFKPSHSTQ